MSDSLTFDILRAANKARLPTFRNSNGDIAHKKADGSDWSVNDWIVALVGEVGEMANVAKKYRRGDISREEFEDFMGKELPDIQIYLDLLSTQVGVDLGEATILKFNEVSERVNSPVRIFRNGQDWYYASSRDAP